MNTVAGAAMDREDNEEETGIGQPANTSALPTRDNRTSQPERDLQPGDPNLVGGAPAEKKKGMAEKVKGLFHGMKGHQEPDEDSAVGSGVGRTPESSPYGTGATDPDHTGHSIDPTGAPAGAAFGNRGAPPDAHPDASDENTASTTPQGVTNDQGGAALTDEHGNLKPGPAQDDVKHEGILSKIKDKLHGSK